MLTEVDIDANGNQNLWSLRRMTSLRLIRDVSMLNCNRSETFSKSKLQRAACETHLDNVINASASRTKVSLCKLAMNGSISK